MKLVCMESSRLRDSKTGLTIKNGQRFDGVLLIQKPRVRELNMAVEGFELVCICARINKKMSKYAYIWTGEVEAQLGYLPSCPPYCIQGNCPGASMEKTRLPSIHECMRRKLTLRIISENFKHTYIPTAHRRNF